MSAVMSTRLRTVAFLGTFALLAVSALPAAAQEMSSPSCGTENLLAGKLPSSSAGHRAEPAPRHGRPGGARGRAVGRAARRRLRHGRRLPDLRPRPAHARVGVRRPGRRQRHLQDLGLARRRAGQLQAARRDRQRRRHRARPAHAARDDRDDDGALPAHRRADRRQLLLDLRVPGLLSGAEPLSAAFHDGGRAAGQGRRAGVLGLRVVGQRRELALRDGAGAGRAGAARLGPLAREEGHARRPPQAARRAARRRGRAVVLRVLELLPVPLRELLPRLGHVPLLRRLEVLQGAVLRPPLRVRRHRRLRGSLAAPTRRAAQDHEPAHEHDAVDGRHPRASRLVQVALHAGALERLHARRRRLPRAPRRQALGGRADRSRLQRDARLEHRGLGPREHGARVGRSGLVPHQDRSALHRRHADDDVVGLRLAHHVRRALRLRDELPVPLLLDGRGRS